MSDEDEDGDGERKDFGKKRKKRSDEWVREKKILKIYLHIYNNRVYLHGYYSRCVYLQT